MQNLTNEQQKAVNEARPALLEKSEYLVTGGAGVGKSFTAAQIMESLKPYGNFTYILTAPTHKACKVLEAMVHALGLTGQVTISTTHSFLNLSPVIDKETGVRRFKPGHKKSRDIEPKDLSKTIVVCDEAGCLEQELLGYLFDVECPKLFLGDKCQLAPVGEREGFIFSLLSDASTELTKVMRYTGHILETATFIREHINSTRLHFPKENDGNEGIFQVSRQYLVKHITDLIKDDEFKHNPNFFKIGTWRNKTMDYWNAYVRQILYPEQTERWFPGLRIVALDSCNDREKVVTPRGKVYWTHINLISASMEAEIKEVTVGRASYGEYFSSNHGGYPPSFKCYYLDCLNELGLEVTIRVVHEDDEKKLADYLESLVKLKQWRLFYDIKDYFHNIGDATSMTVRRLQGSTIKHVVIDRGDITACPKYWERNRIWYVLVTRAQQRVYL